MRVTYSHLLETRNKMKNVKVVGIPNHGLDVSDEKDLLIPHATEFLEDFS
ncbi:MAG: hypothetical protein ACTSO5_10510 [Candidatus Heimdallarchaeaceae archaeon]